MRSLAKVSIALAAILFCFASADGAEISSAAKLRKLSLQIRGIVPTNSDWEELRAAEKKNDVRVFLETKNQEYTASELAADKLASRLFEVLRLGLPEVSLYLKDRMYDRPATSSEVEVAAAFSGLHSFLRELIMQGRSWDEILTTQELLYLPHVGQALNEFVRLKSNLNVRLEKLQASGVAVSSEQDRLNAVKMAMGLIEGPVKFGLPAASEINADVLKDTFRQAMNQLALVDANYKQYASDANVATYASPNYSSSAQSMIADGVRYRVKQFTDLGKADLIDELKCAANLFAIFGNRSPAFTDVECGRLNFRGYILKDRPELIAWMSTLDFTKKSQARAVVERLYEVAFARRDVKAIIGPETVEQAVFSVPSVVSSEDFRMRYKKTKYSRAAAFFRLYMCDDMQPVFLIDNSLKTSKALKGLMAPEADPTADAGGQAVHSDVMTMIDPDAMVMKPTNAGTPLNMAVVEAPIDMHFQEKCAACHRKLDPVQELVDGQSKFSSSVSFVFDQADGVEKRVPISSFEEFNKVVVGQYQYQRCQTERFWNWMIGEDVPLAGERRQEVMTKFDELGRKPMPFISYLASQPEFSSDDVITQVPNFGTVRSVLNRCNGCHVSEFEAPRLTKTPFLSESDELMGEAPTTAHVRTLRRIVVTTDMSHHGAAATMPKKEAGWSLTEDERVALGRWIYHGARDDFGQTTIEPKDLEKIFKDQSEDFLKFIATEKKPEATFRETWKRYYENSDLLAVLSQKFPQTFSKCASQFDPSQRGFLGFNDIASGAPTSAAPGMTMVSWLSACLFKITSAELQSGSSSANRSHVFGLSVLANAEAEAALLARKYLTLSQAEKEALVNAQIDALIGPQVLTVEKQKSLANQVLRALEKYVQKTGRDTVSDAAMISVNLIMNDQAFLTY